MVCTPTVYVTLLLRTVNPRAETPVALSIIVLAVTLAGALLLWIATPARRDAVDTQAATVQPA